MKLNKKMTIPAFTLLAAASLVGSISGTIAWYQYSTRANVAYIGSSAGTIGNLQVKLGDDGQWGTQVTFDDVNNYFRDQHIDQDIRPVTPGALEKNDFLKQLGYDDGETIEVVEDLNSVAVVSEGKLCVKVVEVEDPVDPQHNPSTFTYSLWKYAPIDIDDAAPWKATDEIAINPTDDEKAAHVNDAKYQYIQSNPTSAKLYSRTVGNAKDFYSNPTFGNGPYSKWLKAEANNYVKLPLQLRFIGNDADDLKASEIYLSKFVIKNDRNNGSHKDISDAIRVHFSAYEENDEVNAINHLVSKKGGTVATEGRLKIGRGSDFDKAYTSENDIWGFEGSKYDYVRYGKGSQNSYGSVIEDEESTGEFYQWYSKDHVYYEDDGSTAETKSWEDVAATVGTDDKDVDEGNPGDLYIKKVNVGQENESRELYEKKPNKWVAVTDNTVVKTGTDLPDGDLGCTYYLRSHNDALYALYIYENGVWAETDSVADFDNAENADLDALRLDKANQRLMQRVPDEWALVDASKYEYKKDVDLSSKPLTYKADGYVEDKLYIDSNNGLYRFVGKVFKEKISSILVKENVDANHPLAIGGLEEDKIIAKTTEDHIVHVDVTIWVEGWQKFANGSNFTSIWEAGFIGSMFDVGMQFAVQDLDA